MASRFNLRWGDEEMSQVSHMRHGDFLTGQDHSALQRSVIAEERRLQLISTLPGLKNFSRRIEHWEMLIRILQQEGSRSIGLNEIPRLCRHGSMHHHSMAKFLRDQVAVGLLVVEEGDRSDKKILRANDLLASSFLSLTARGEG